MSFIRSRELSETQARMLSTKDGEQIVSEIREHAMTGRVVRSTIHGSEPNTVEDHDRLVELFARDSISGGR